MCYFLVPILTIALGLILLKYIARKRSSIKPDVLVGKNVLICGASSGIGKAVALEYAQNGANVFVTARREIELKEVVDMCKEIGGNDATFGYVSSDMVEYKTEAERVIKEAVQCLGSLDHMILNHAIMDVPENTVGWTGSEDQLLNIEAQLNVGFMSYVYLTAHALPHMEKATSARIGVTGSIAGKTTFRGMPSYCAVKFALDGFFGALRELLEHKGSNVTISYYALGPVATGRMYDIPKWLFNGNKFTMLMPQTPLAVAAREIVALTSRGEAELYLPHLLGWIPGGLKILPIARHIRHNLLYGS